MITFYNTLSRKKETFTSIKPNEVSVYTCGPTVYHYVHLGNLRTFVFEDLLIRSLRHAGYTVNHVMNITDVGHLTDDADSGEDKMEKGSKREGKTAWEIAEYYTDACKQDMQHLNIKEPNTWCKATDHIKEQIDQVQALIDAGFTYETNDGIYFNTKAYPAYGELAQLQKQELQAGARVDMGEKKHPNDFALWKFSHPNEQRQMEWEAFGKKGFPGWHIECSAMAMKYLGDHIDIHCGGIDLVPVHHVNEIAQAECAGSHKPWVNTWMHGEFLLVSDGKMSKSADNFLRLQSIIDKGISPLAYRYFLLQGHYRKELTFSWEALQAAANGLQNLKKQIAGLPEAGEHVNVTTAFFNAVYDDLNMPEALAVLWKALKEKTLSQEMIQEFDNILGLNLLTPLENETLTEIPEDIQTLLEQRKQARAQKNWQTSDEIRDKLATKGYLVKDTDQGQTLTKQ